jgi:hypothetical protein
MSFDPACGTAHAMSPDFLQRVDNQTSHVEYPNERSLCKLRQLICQIQDVRLDLKQELSLYAVVLECGNMASTDCRLGTDNVLS